MVDIMKQIEHLQTNQEEEQQRHAHDSAQALDQARIDKERELAHIREE